MKITGKTVNSFGLLFSDVRNRNILQDIKNMEKVIGKVMKKAYEKNRELFQNGENEIRRSKNVYTN